MCEVHGNCIEIKGVGILLLGESGSGKSDLTLRAMAQGANLVADDIVLINKNNDYLEASAPDNLRGLLEVRGLGIVKKDFKESVKIGLVAILTEQDKILRLPEEEIYNVAGLMLKQIKINPFEISAVEKLKIAVNLVLGIEELHEGS